MFKQTLNPLTSKVNISSTTSSTSSPSLLSTISSSSPDLVLLCGDGASPLLLHSAVAQSHFPVIFNVFQVILNINVLIFLVTTLLSYHHGHHHHPGFDGVKRAKSVLERERPGGDQPALIIIAIIIVIVVSIIITITIITRWRSTCPPPPLTSSPASSPPSTQTCPSSTLARSGLRWGRLVKVNKTNNTFLQVGSLLDLLGVPSHLYMIADFKEDDKMMGEITSILDKTFTKDDLEQMLMGKDDGEPVVDVGQMEKLLEEDMDVTLGENVIEVVKKEENKELKPEDKKWQKELAAAGYDPRIRR